MQANGTGLVANPRAVRIARRPPRSPLGSGSCYPRLVEDSKRAERASAVITFRSRGYAPTSVTAATVPLIGPTRPSVPADTPDRRRYPWYAHTFEEEGPVQHRHVVIQ